MDSLRCMRGRRAAPFAALLVHDVFSSCALLSRLAQIHCAVDRFICSECHAGTVANWVSLETHAGERDVLPLERTLASQIRVVNNGLQCGVK